jgi:formamidopyrimidine-DNA glycosylase
MDRLGVEPFDPCLTPRWLREQLGRSRRAVKTCLLDQSVVAGIGNIYSDEILFAARIHPQRPASSLTAPEWKRLAETIPGLMQFHVEQIHADNDEYLRTRGREYRNTPFLRVYGHAGEPCSNCGTKLERVVIGGRSSVFCPKCQSVKINN